MPALFSESDIVQDIALPGTRRAEPHVGTGRPRHPALVRHEARQAALNPALTIERRRPSRIIAEQRETIAEQDALIELLKGALAAAGLEELPAYQSWMKGLTPQERALLGALYRCYPRPLDKHALLDLLPGQDHVEERDAKLVATKVCHLRKKLGADAIENIPGIGYRLSRQRYDAMRRAEATPSAGLKLAA